MPSAQRPRTWVAFISAVAVVLVVTGCAPTPRSIPVPTAMSTARFWKLIDAARATTNLRARSASPHAVREQLDRLSDKDVAAFAVRYDDFMVELNRWSVWGAGYTVAQGMGDDDFDYFRAWLIGKGQKAVDAALTDPDQLVNYLAPADESQDGFDNEDLDYLDNDVFAARHGQSSADNFDDKIGTTIDDDPPGHPFDEKTVHLQYPLLDEWAKQHDH